MAITSTGFAIILVSLMLLTVRHPQIDIIEGVHDSAANAAALHTSQGCTMENAAEDTFEASPQGQTAAAAAEGSGPDACVQCFLLAASIAFPPSCSESGNAVAAMAKILG